MICTSQIEKNEMGKVYSTYGESRVEYRVLVGKPEGKRPLGRPTHRWVDNIKMDLKEMEWRGPGLGYGQVAGTCECGNEPSVCIKCG